MTEETKIKPGPKWTNDKTLSTHLEKQESMQTKIRLRSDGRYLVKYRKEPIHNEKEIKDGNHNRKNKRTTNSPKFDAYTSI